MGKNVKQLAKKLLKKLKLQKIGEEHLVADINKDMTTSQKKILISYLDYAETMYHTREGFGHTNRMELVQMIKVCIEKGWCIDVCGCNSVNAEEEMRSDYYDYILGFGRNFFLAKEKNPNAKTILYMTENPYDISFVRETERIQYFTERTGRKFALERTGVYYQKDDEKKADVVICLGDEKYLKDKCGEVYRIWPSAMKNPTFELRFDKKKKTSFMVYGVDGFVHKGNDLLVELFERHPEWELFLCGARGAEKAKEAGYSLPQNVHAVGYVDTRSEQFKEKVGQCYYLLLPSCSEAPSTAVLTGMRHGMIPIVSRGIGLDELEEYCLYFEDFKMQYIEETIENATHTEEAVLQKCSERTLAYAEERYTLENYTDSIRKVLGKM